MTTITLYRATIREGACAQEDDFSIFDAEADRIFAAITEKAKAQALTIVVNDGRSHGPSYTVDAGESYEDEEAAHDFMQSPAAEFWSYL